jgi:hypothetical protein
MLREMSPEYAKTLEEIKKSLDKGFKKVARGQQERLTQLLGRLDEKYTVGLSVASMDFAWLPFTIRLADYLQTVQALSHPQLM